MDPIIAPISGYGTAKTVSFLISLALVRVIAIQLTSGRRRPTGSAGPVRKRPSLSGGERDAKSPAVQLERIRSAARSAIIMVGALVLPPISVGITEASITRSPSTPRTRNCVSTTEASSLPMRQVPMGW